MNGSGFITRRLFVQVGAVASGALALAGCTWTPRNAETSQGASSGPSTQSEVAASSEGVSASASAPAIDDGLVLVEGGTFIMGSPADEPWRSGDEEQHEATVGDFYLSPTEVSQLEYNTLMGLEGAADGVPVVNVTWYDAIAYCNALSAEADLEPVYTVDGDNVRARKSGRFAAMGVVGSAKASRQSRNSCQLRTWAKAFPSIIRVVRICRSKLLIGLRKTLSRRALA